MTKFQAQYISSDPKSEPYTYELGRDPRELRTERDWFAINVKNLTVRTVRRNGRLGIIMLGADTVDGTYCRAYVFAA